MLKEMKVNSAKKKKRIKEKLKKIGKDVWSGVW